MGFIPGGKGQPEGLVSITSGAMGKHEYGAIVERARNTGIQSDESFEICGIKWSLALAGQGETTGKL
jgi:hypothetical protein